MKLEGWEKKLNDTIESYYAVPFSWADSSCAHFVADCVLAMTGIDYMEKMRGKWNDEKTANEFIVNSAGSLSGFLASFESINKVFAQRGDIAIIKMNNQEFMGIVGLDPRFVLVRAESGIKKFKIKALGDVNFWRP